MKQTKWLVIGALAFAPMLAHADDWACEVVLCLSNPQGATAVKECVPPIKKLWRELAKGHAFPTCNMNTEGARGNSASNNWASGRNCPPQYRYWGGVEGSELMCQFSGVVTVKVANQLYTRVWWNGGETYTQDYSKAVSIPGASMQAAAAPAANED